MKKENIIRETKDYNSFEFIDYNRNINQGHLKNITNSINQIGQINPISTFWNNKTKKYGIYDGQHRFLGVKTLQKPIKFIVYVVNLLNLRAPLVTAPPVVEADNSNAVSLVTLLTVAALGIPTPVTDIPA